MRAIDIPREKLSTMYLEEYLSLKDIAEFLGCSAGAVRRNMINFNIPRRDKCELRSYPQALCSRCGKLKPSSKHDICKDCWAKKHGRERWPGGRLMPLRYVRTKRKFKVCLNCGGSVAAWNRSGYCVKCYKLTEVKKEMACRFCIICEKAISNSNLSGYCRDCSNGQRLKKTIFKRGEALKIIDRALSDLNTEEETRTEVLMVFMNLLRRRFFFGYTGNNHNALRGGLNETHR